MDTTLTAGRAAEPSRTLCGPATLAMLGGGGGTFDLCQGLGFLGSWALGYYIQEFAFEIL